MTPLVVLLVFLVTYRITLIVVADEITEPPRGWVFEHVAPDGRLATLLSCPWCVSWWVGLGVSVSAWHWADTAWWTVVAVALSASAVTGFLATFASPGD